MSTGVGRSGAAAADAALRAATDPIGPLFLEDPWDASPIGESPLLHAAALDRLVGVAMDVGVSGRSRAALLLGETGTGKSHLLRRLRDRLGRGVFCAVPRVTTIDGLARSVLARVCADLRRVRPGTRHQQGHGLIIDLLTPVHERVVSDPRLRPLRDAIARVPSGHSIYSEEPIVDSLSVVASGHLAGSGQAIAAMARDVVGALLRTRDPSREGLAWDWLRAIDLSPEDRARLGVRRTLADEGAAIEALGSLVAATGAGPIVLAFDQTESIPDDAAGRPAIADLARLVCQLHAFAGYCLVVTCLRDVWYHDYRDRLIVTERQRLERELVELEGLDASLGVDLIERRLQPVFDDLDPPPPFPTYPIPAAQIEALFDRGPLPARDLLAYVADRIAALGRERRAEDDDPARPASGAAARLTALLRDRTERLLAPGNAPVGGDRLLSAAALLLDRAVQRELTPQIEGVVRPAASTPDVVIASVRRRNRPPHRVALLSCESGDGRTFHRAVTEAAELVESGDLLRVILTRAETVPASWVAGTRELARFQLSGGRRVSPRRTDVARILTAAALIEEAGDGDGLAADEGPAIPPDEVARFLFEDARILRTTPLKELLG